MVVAVSETFTYGDFAELLNPGSRWYQAGFPQPDGEMWMYREPDAIVLVKEGRLSVAVPKLTRAHDGVQILDNAKHMYWSTEQLTVPDGGAIEIETEIRATLLHGDPDNLYDGFVSLNLLEFGQAMAVNVFVSETQFTPVYARLPFPGTPPPEEGEPRYFCIFNEMQLPKGPRERHRYTVRYSQATDEITWLVNGEEMARQRDVPVKLRAFTAALGIMTELDIDRAAGRSVSCHGQGVAGEWSPLEVTRYEAGEL